MIEAEHGPFSITPWLESGDEVNGSIFADKAKARGRYEIAEQFHRIGMDWYGREVVQGMQGDSEERLGRFRAHHAEQHAYLPEFRELVATRQAIVSLLGNHPTGIERENLKKMVRHGGATKLGVICNQLDRGGFLRQAKEGKQTMLYPVSSAPISNEEFLKSEIPAPGTSGMWV